MNLALGHIKENFIFFLFLPPINTYTLSTKKCLLKSGKKENDKLYFWSNKHAATTAKEKRKREKNKKNNENSRQIAIKLKAI